MSDLGFSDGSLSPLSETTEFKYPDRGIASSDRTVRSYLRKAKHQILRLRHSHMISWYVLRRVLALVLVFVLVLALVISKRVHQKAVLLESDFPDFSNDKDRRLARKNLASSHDFPFEEGCREIDNSKPRANASFVMLSRNSELDDVVSSMKSMERHFNQWYNYPWVFLNDVEFSTEFKETVKKHTNAKVEFGLVPQEHWNFPESVDRTEFLEHIEAQGDRKVMYGNMESYHKMCRFYSGHFYDHPLVRKREWYWRVEPDVEFFCDLTYDPFLEMEKHNKKYGFTVTIGELYYTAPSLFMYTKAFIKEHDIKVQSAWDIVAEKYDTVKGKNSKQYDSWKDFADLRDQVEKNVNLRKLLDKPHKTDADFKSFQNFEHVRDIFEKATEKPLLYEDRVADEEYNLCHFWSNFEIAKTEIFLSQTYQEYFKFLEDSGGFYKERWGDAPVHSIAVAMMLPKEQIHYFRDIGYRHSTLGHCPNNAPNKQLPYKENGFKDTAVKPWHSIFWKTQPDDPVKNGVGCRCVCPRGFRELENKNSKCLKRFAHVLSDNYKPKMPADLDKLERLAERGVERKLKSGQKLGQDTNK